MEYVGDKDMEPRQVAVKKLKTTAVSTCLQDFEREISIMKVISHTNCIDYIIINAIICADTQASQHC